MPQAKLSAAGRQHTLLLVDDEANILSALKRLLRSSGYQILTATSGQEALQLLPQHPVDLVISDQRMPHMTGVDFLRQVKTLYPDTIRIVLSGYTELDSVTSAINEGAIYKFLTKPWEDDQLKAHITEALRIKDMQDENLQLAAELHASNAELKRVNAELSYWLALKQQRLNSEETVLQITQSLLEYIPFPMLGIDLQGMLVFLNQAARRELQNAFVPGAMLADIEPPLSRLPGELQRHPFGPPDSSAGELWIWLPKGSAA